MALRNVTALTCQRLPSALTVCFACIGLLVFQASISSVAHAQESEETAEEETLPTLEELEIPTVKDLLLKPPVDWLVLKTDEQVIVTSPVHPRPDTLEKMQKRLDELISEGGPRKTDEQKAAYLKRKDELSKITVIFAESDDRTEYEIDMKHVDRIIYHEDLLLKRIALLVEEKDFRQAYEMLYRLRRRQPDWRGIEEQHDSILFFEALHHSEKERYESALYFFEELHARTPNYPQLVEEMGNATDQLITAAVEDKNYRKARHFIRRLKKTIAEHAVVTRWSEELSKQAAGLMSSAQTEYDAGQYAKAVALVEQAVVVWPDFPGLRAMHRGVTSRYQRLKTGVLRLPHTPSRYFLPTAEDNRDSYITSTRLFEVAGSDEVAHYKSSFFEEWEPNDLGRQTIFKLKQGRPYWDTRPIINSSRIAHELGQRLDANTAHYDERLASYIRSYTVLSPFELEVTFSRVPPRMEALFHFKWHDEQKVSETNSQQETAVPTAARFEVVERNDDHIVYRRPTPEPDGMPEYHVAEIEEIRFPSHDDAIQALARGQVAMLPNIPAWDVDRIEADDRFYVRQYQLPTTHLIQINPRSSVMQNRELRRAMAFGINRPQILEEEILQQPGSKRGRVVTGPFPSKGYAYNSQVEMRDYDLTLAYSLVVAAKKQLGTDIPTLKMLCVPDSIAQKAAVKITKYWERLGIKVEIITDDATEAAANQQPEDWDIIYRTVVMAEPVFDIWPFLTFDPQSRVTSIGYLAPLLRQDLIELENTVNWRNAVRIMQQTHLHLWAEVQVIPLWEVDNYLVMRQDIRGFTPSPMSAYEEIQNWVIDPWYPNE